MRNDPLVNEVTGDLEQNPVKQCFGWVPDQPHIFARECYDQRLNRLQSKVVPRYCPFDIPSGEYGWINETLKAYDDLKSGTEKIDPKTAVSSWKFKKLKAYCQEVIGLR